MPVISAAFIHPNQLINNNTQTETRLPNINAQADGFNVIDIVIGSHPMAAFVDQEGGLVFHYGLIRPKGFSGRIDAGYFSNRNSGGSSVKTIPLMFNVLFGYPVQSRIDTYSGFGLGVIAFQDAVSKIGFGYQWFSGITLGITSDMSLFTEYGRQYCSIDNQNLDAEMVKFGLTFKFFPR